MTEYAERDLEEQGAMDRLVSAVERRHRAYIALLPYSDECELALPMDLIDEQEAAEAEYRKAAEPVDLIAKEIQTGIRN